eukprot:06779_1
MLRAPCHRAQRSIALLSLAASFPEPGCKASTTSPRSQWNTLDARGDARRARIHCFRSTCRTRSASHPADRRQYCLRQRLQYVRQPALCLPRRLFGKRALVRRLSTTRIGSRGSVPRPRRCLAPTGHMSRNVAWPCPAWLCHRDAGAAACRGRGAWYRWGARASQPWRRGWWQARVTSPDPAPGSSCPDTFSCCLAGLGLEQRWPHHRAPPDGPRGGMRCSAATRAQCGTSQESRCVRIPQAARPHCTPYTRPGFQRSALSPSHSTALPTACRCRGRLGASLVCVPRGTGLDRCFRFRTGSETGRCACQSGVALLLLARARRTIQTCPCSGSAAGMRRMRLQHLRACRRRVWSHRASKTLHCTCHRRFRRPLPRGYGGCGRRGGDCRRRAPRSRQRGNRRQTPCQYQRSSRKAGTRCPQDHRTQPCHRCRRPQYSMVRESILRHQRHAQLRLQEETVLEDARALSSVIQMLQSLTNVRALYQVLYPSIQGHLAQIPKRSEMHMPS